jgi:hypothetical protein
MLAAAGFDPVFFAHHANIDRLWSKWLSIAGHANPSNDGWLKDQPFYFYDQAQTRIGIFPGQVVDTESLSYRYQPPDWPPGTPAAVAAAAVNTAPEARTARIVPLGTPLVALDAGSEQNVLSSAPTTLQVAIPAEATQLPSSPDLQSP